MKKSEKDKSEYVTVRLTAEAKALLEAVSLQTGKPLSALVRRAIGATYLTEATIEVNDPKGGTK